MITGRRQGLVLSVATFAALASGFLSPPASIALSIEPGSTFARSHAPVPQAFGGFVPPGSTQGAFFGPGYDEWVETLAEEPELTQAGGHPDSTTSFQLQGASSEPDGSTKDVFIDLPAGAVANPLAVPGCEAADFNLTLLGHCPTESQVGVAATDASPLRTLSPLSKLTPSPGEPLLIGFKVFGVSVLMHPRVRTEGDYGFTIEARDVPTTLALGGATLTLWGVPYDPVHDSHRFDAEIGALGASVSGPVIPLTSAPTSCDTGPLRTALKVRSWGSPEHWFGEEATASEQTGCEAIEFDPEVSATPTTDVADSPTGLGIDIRIPQDGRCEAGPPVECRLVTSHLRDTTITLPEGIALNPSGANGLAGCSSSEIGLTTPPGSRPIHFTAEPADCPDAAKIGTAEIETPLLEAPLFGTVYIADPNDNPFISLLAIYIEVENSERGVVAKFAAHVAADPGNGQLTATVEDGPPLPIERIRLDLKQGPHAPLRTPASCGDYSSTAELTPYAAPSSPVVVNEDWSIVRGPGGGCSRPTAPDFEAGAVRPIAGALSPFVAQLGREDGAQQLRSLTMELPTGLVAYLSGIPLCRESSLASLDSPTGGGDGSRAGDPCPPASRIGSDFISVGAGVHPYFLDEGPIYLAGPYRGAPYSLARSSSPPRPAPSTSAPSSSAPRSTSTPEPPRPASPLDPLPQIREGIPLRYRAIRLVLDRPGLIRNPTSCEPTRISRNGDRRRRRDRRPLSPLPGRRLRRARLQAQRSPSASPAASPATAIPALRAVLRPRAGEAATSPPPTFTLPAGELLDLRRVRALCARAACAAERCPPRSRLGHARLWSPLLGAPLAGPDLPARARAAASPTCSPSCAAAGCTSSSTATPPPRGGRLRVRFPALPDIPLSRAVFTLAGGRRGIFVNSESLCARRRRATRRPRRPQRQAPPPPPAAPPRGRC